MAGVKKQWGVTGPINEALPTAAELALNDALLDELKSRNNFESPEDTARRTVVLRSLQDIATEFVKFMGRKKGMPSTIVNEAAAKIFTFGSYRLGAFSPGSDIDTLVVVPKYVTREDFNQYFPQMLEKMAPKDAIEELKVVAEAFVPIINFQYSGIDIDLVMVKLMLTSIPQTMDIKDNALLRGLDDLDLRCINGTRVSDEMLTLVPQVKTFRHALRAIKLWANQRGMYSNKVGFPGGVAWAIMVARICQLYPNAAGSRVVNRFFHIMESWPWPVPVQLKGFEEGPLQVRVWNPKLYPGDNRHIMPVITPAYPAMCSTHNVMLSTKKLIQRELLRAGEIVDLISDGKMEWKDLFQKHTFFTQDYRYYLSIIAASRTKDAQNVWSGYIQSRIRRLVSGIEMSEAGVELAHPFNAGFERVHQCKNEDEIDMVLKGDLQFQLSDLKTTTTDETNDATQVAAAEANGDGMTMPKVETPNEEDIATGGECVTVYTTTYYVGLELQAESKGSLDISFPVLAFKRDCLEWPQYSKDVNSLQIIHTRNYDLPMDVFEPGEVRPQRTKKTKAGKVAPPLTKKRSFAASNTDGNDDASSAKRRQPSDMPGAPPGT